MSEIGWKADSPLSGAASVKAVVADGVVPRLRLGMLRALIQVFGGLFGAPVPEDGRRRTRLLALAFIIGGFVAVVWLAI